MATDKEIIDSLKTDWLPTDYYNFEDLNLVEQATSIVGNTLENFRGVVIPLTTVQNRTISSIEFADSLNRIEENILTLIDTFPNKTIFDSTVIVWAFNMPFDYNDANRFARNLKTMFTYIQSNITNRPYTGQFIVGQEGVY